VVRDDQPDAREGQAGALGSRRGSLYRGSRVIPGEGRDLSSRRTQYVVRDLEIGNLSTPNGVQKLPEGVARESEGRSRLSLLRPVRQDQPRGYPGPRLCPVPAPTRVHRVWMVKTSRTSKRMGCNGGLANWRLRSGRRLTDLTHQKSVHTEGQWQTQAVGISTLRDRVCMTAAMLVLEPIFEADLP